MVDIVGTGLAFAPFLVAVVALLVLRLPALWAGFAALVAAVLGSVLWPELEAARLPGALLDGAGTSAQVLYVLFGGLLLYNLLRAGGAVDAVSRYLGRLEPQKEALAAGIVVGVAPFFESVTGFGVAVVISAPILLAAGFPPIKAAVLASWGQCAVPWGALGVGTVIGADLAGMDFRELSTTSAYLNLPLYPIYSVSAVVLAGGIGGLRRHGIEAVVIGSAAGIGTLATSLYLVPELSGAVGGLCATALFLGLRWRRLSGLPGRAVLPYGFLLSLLALVSGAPVVGEFLEDLGSVFTGPGLPLLLTAGFTAMLFGIDDVGGAVRDTFTQWLPTAGTVLAFVLAGEVVASSGAAALLATEAESFGGLYPVVSSVLGALGGGLTGSNAASNALFMPLQVEAARGVGMPADIIAAVQNVAGSHASLLSPQRIVLAATAVGILGREGEILRSALAPVLASIVLLALIGLLTS